MPVLVRMTPTVQSNCLDALVESARELAGTSFGGMAFEELGSTDDFGVGHGAYLGLSAQDEPIQVGILVDSAGCQALAKALLGMEPADEDLPDSDVGDAMCEVINMLAGGLKRRVSEQMAVTMGLPMFVAGQPLPNHQQTAVARRLKLGEVAAHVILLTQKQNAVPASRKASTKLTAVKLPAEEHSP